ncbi:hypothetical protein [Bifidobacterium gallicum]|uniref:Uncharacterized protein n=2 Tax=Bifidobacterium gallicum DSM 20093 = LMG 11596 TaxID=561180 RepID=A0A087AIZ0_9BIFI|nr:hypothetical protein [Bifidobacterium gallicum]KFI58740.1 hypothetical protein BGLCM_1034 [Bifidobacterium gallicum DSM 20093 = LMG 11596]
MAKGKQAKPRHPIDIDEAKDTLRRFVVRARRVAAHSMVKDQSVLKYVNPTFTIQRREGEPIRLKYHMPDQEVFESLAARTRPCILEREPVYLDKVFRSVTMCLGARKMSETAQKCFDECKAHFAHLRDKDGGTSYSIQMFDTNDVPQGEPMSDLLIGEAWLYSDLVHTDPQGRKAEATALSYRDRYYAGTSFFSQLSIIIVNMLNLITALNRDFGFGIDPKAWEEQVVAADEDSERVAENMYMLPQGTQIPDGVRPKDMPNAVDVSSMTETAWALNPQQRATIILCKADGQLVDRFHGIYSWNDDKMTLLVGDTFICELGIGQQAALPAGFKEIEVTRRVFKGDPTMTTKVWDAVKRADLMIGVIPRKEGTAYVIVPFRENQVHVENGRMLVRSAVEEDHPTGGTSM